MRVLVESRLPCSADEAWRLVQSSKLLCEVCWPMCRFRNEDGGPLPEHWSTERPVRCRAYLFGFIPTGVRTLAFERIDEQAKEIQTREHEPLIPRWDHLISVKDAGPGACLYSDEITIEAGWRTFGVWLFAQMFYRHRQRRWKKVARRETAANQRER